MSIGCSSLDDSDSGDRSLEDIVKANGEYVSTNAREFALTARSYARFPNNYVDLDESSKQAALERAMDRRRVFWLAESKPILIRSCAHSITGDRRKGCVFYLLQEKRVAVSRLHCPVGDSLFEFEFSLSCG